VVAEPVPDEVHAERCPVLPQRLRELFGAIESRLHRYPAVDPASFRKRLSDVLAARS